MNTNSIPFNIRLFDGAGDASAVYNTTAAAEQSATNEAGSQTEGAASENGAQPLSPVQENGGEDSLDESISYKQWKDRFKDQYQADVQRIIDKRFKNSKKVEAQRDALLEQNKQYEALMEALGERYGTEDIDRLIGKIAFDDEYLAAKAQSENMSVEDYKRLHQAQKQAEDYKHELESMKQAVQQQALIEKWQQEAQALCELYPEFNLEDEVDNERFSLALQNGMTMKDAYQYAHFDEILSGAIRYTAENVKSAVAQNMAQRAQRPVENGIRNGAAAIVKNDIQKLTRQDMEEIDRLVLRGERISF